MKIKQKIIKLNISDQVDVNYRNYAIYTLENRGIPAFDDALTNVQRIILNNAKGSFDKTLSLVGDCIKDGYHHGNCLEYNTSINLGDDSTITIGEWTEKYPDANFIVKSKDKNGNSVYGLGHSPRIGQITNEIFEIELENNEILKCTGNHPFLIDGKWILAQDLIEGMNCDEW